MKKIILLSLFIMAIGCGKKIKELPTAKKEIKNYKKIDKMFPAVVSLETSEGLCTGTFINDHTILSSATCFTNFPIDDQGRVHTDVSIKELKTVSTQVIIDKKFLPAEYNLLSGKGSDLAVIFVPKGRSKNSLKLNKTFPLEHEIVNFVGHKCLGEYNISRKRCHKIGSLIIGEGLYSGYDGDSIFIQARNSFNYEKGFNANLLSEDNGSPVIQNDKIIGIARNSHSSNFNYSYSRVDSAAARSFLKHAFSLYEKDATNNKNKFLKLCNIKRYKNTYHRDILKKVLKSKGLKNCKELSYRYPLYKTIDLSGLNLKRAEKTNLLNKLKYFKYLNHLKLSNTKITNLSFLNPLKYLKSLDLENNPEIEDYNILKNIKTLDFVKMSEKEFINQELRPAIIGLNMPQTWETGCLKASERSRNLTHHRHDSYKLKIDFNKGVAVFDFFNQRKLNEEGEIDLCHYWDDRDSEFATAYFNNYSWERKVTNFTYTLGEIKDDLREINFTYSYTNWDKDIYSSRDFTYFKIKGNQLMLGQFSSQYYISREKKLAPNEMDIYNIVDKAEQKDNWPFNKSSLR